MKFVLVQDTSRKPTILCINSCFHIDVIYPVSSFLGSDREILKMFLINKIDILWEISGWKWEQIHSHCLSSMLLTEPFNRFVHTHTEFCPGNMYPAQFVHASALFRDLNPCMGVCGPTAIATLWFSLDLSSEQGHCLICSCFCCWLEGRSPRVKELGVAKALFGSKTEQSCQNKWTITRGAAHCLFSLQGFTAQSKSSESRFKHTVNP